MVLGAEFVLRDTIVAKIVRQQRSENAIFSRIFRIAPFLGGKEIFNLITPEESEITLESCRLQQ